VQKRGLWPFSSFTALDLTATSTAASVSQPAQPPVLHSDVVDASHPFISLTFYVCACVCVCVRARPLTRSLARSLDLSFDLFRLLALSLSLSLSLSLLLSVGLCLCGSARVCDIRIHKTNAHDRQDYLTEPAHFLELRLEMRSVIRRRHSKNDVF